jgi:hypothetical protein
MKKRTKAVRYDWEAITLALVIADWRPRGWGRAWADERGILQFGAPDVDQRFTVLFKQFCERVRDASRRTRRRRRIKPGQRRLKPAQPSNASH